MALLKKLWFEEGLYPVEDYDFHDVDEYDYNYDFYDIDDDRPVTGEDDGKFNFGDIDLGDETAEGDWDMNEDHPVEPEPGSVDHNFYSIDDDPPVTGEDDGTAEFGDIDIEPGSEGTAEGDWDMGNAEDDEEYIYDFYDIEEHPDLKPTQYDITYDFGDTDTVEWQKTKNFLIAALEDSLQEILNKEVLLAEVDLDQMTVPYVTLQYYYNERTNKSFIQFDIYNYTGIINHDRFVTLMNWKINSQFKYDTGINPEVINTRNKDIVPNNRVSVTPYTIGFWESVDGRYEAIEDRTEVELDLRDTNTPPNKTYNIWNLCQVAENINRNYNTLVTNDIMAPEDKEVYIEKYREILTQYHDKTYKDIYRAKVNELDEQYNPYKYTNDNIPDAVREFVAYYKEYFQCNIPDIYSYTRRCKLKMANL